jgi:UDP-galactose transporter B1
MVISYFYAVMLMGTLVYGIRKVQRYTLPEYLCTFLVTGGVSTFALLKVMIIPMRKTTIFFPS